LNLAYLDDGEAASREEHAHLVAEREDHIPVFVSVLFRQTRVFMDKLGHVSFREGAETYILQEVDKAEVQLVESDFLDNGANCFKCELLIVLCLIELLITVIVAINVGGI